jgi:hypothetical protein
LHPLGSHLLAGIGLCSAAVLLSARANKQTPAGDGSPAAKGRAPTPQCAANRQQQPRKVPFSHLSSSTLAAGDMAPKDLAAEQQGQVQHQAAVRGWGLPPTAQWALNFTI